MTVHSKEVLEQELWSHKASKGLGTILDEIRREAVYQAQQLGVADPDNAAADALEHLVLQVAEHVEKFVRVVPPEVVPPEVEAGKVMVRVYAQEFRWWARAVIRNRLYSILRAQRSHMSVQGVTVEQLEFYAEQNAELSGSDSPWSADYETLLEERDKLVILLDLLLEMKESHRDLILGRMAGFTRLQLEEQVGFTPGSQSVIVNRQRPRFEARPKELEVGRQTLFQPPELDLPLTGPDTPLLSRALVALKEQPGTRLLGAVQRLKGGLKPSFQARLAGFWDCVTATCLELELKEQSTRIQQGRERIENFLLSRERGSGASSGPHTPLPPSGSKPSNRRINAMQPSENHRHVNRLHKLSEEAPEQALLALLEDPAVFSGLSRGRARMLAQARETRDAHLTQQVSLVDRLLSLATDAIDEAARWLEIPVMQPLAIRGEATSAPQTERQQSVPLVFSEELRQGNNPHCFVWQLEGQELRLLYPRLPSDPLRRRELAGQTFLARRSMEQPDICLLLMQVRSEALATQLKTMARREGELQAWLASHLLTEASTDVEVQRVTLHSATTSDVG